MTRRATPSSEAELDRARRGPARIVVWDLPVRLFHWALVAALVCAWVFVWMGEMTWHMYAGYTAATLVVFRLVWGLVGSETARFARFVRGPAAIRRYLAGERQERPGHNPLGALSVLAMLLFVLTQAGTGLFSNDDIFFDGPWAGVLTKDWSDTVTAYHKLNKNILLALVALHLGAVWWYWRRGENLVGPMVTGRAAADSGTEEPRRRPVWLAAALLAVSAAAVGVAFRFWWL